MRGASLIALSCMLASPVQAAVHDWANTCTIWHSNPDNRRDPTFVWDTSQNPVGQCPGYDNTIYAFKPCNNAVGGWNTVPLAQFGVSRHAREIRVTGRVEPFTNGAGMYLYIRAPGSTWFHSNNLSFYWATNVSFTMPVANGAVEYMLTKAGTMPLPAIYTVNFILDGWCE